MEKMGTVHTDPKSMDAGEDICETSVYVPYKPDRDSPHFFHINYLTGRRYASG